MFDVASVLGDLVGKLPNLTNGLLKLFYKKETIHNRIIIDLASHKSAVKTQLLGSSDMSVYIRVGNYTPFDLTVESITLKFRWEETSIKLSKVNFQTVPKNSEIHIYISEDITEEQAIKIAIAADSERKNTPYLYYDVDLSNRLYRLQKSNEFREFPLEIINKDNAIKRLKKAS